MRRKLYCYLAILSMVVFLIGNGHSQISSQEVDQLVENAMTKFGVAGVAVGIVKDGKVFHSKGYGVKSIISKSPVNEHTNFDIASNSKAFTTTALAILVEEGKLSWTSKVVDIIPEFKMYNPYVTANFNIQDLVTHRSGLGLGAGDLIFFPNGTDFTIKDVLTNFQYFEPVSAFRTKYDYDNLLYIVAGEVIARISGLSWEMFVKERILEPLNMDNTYTNILYIRDKSNLASPHSTDTGEMKVVKRDSFDPEKLNGAAAAIVSNVDDLCQWMLLHLNHGKYGEKGDIQLFSAESQREMWKIHTTINSKPDPHYNTHFEGYGLGWRLSDKNGKMSVSHGGALTGMLSKTEMIPDLNLGIVILTNTWIEGSYLFNAVNKTLIDRYLGLNAFDWIEEYYKRMQKSVSNADLVVSKVWQTVNSSKSSTVDIQHYIGVYQDNWFGKAEVFMKNDQLWFKFYRSPKLNGPMYFYKGNTFAIKWEYQDTNCDAFAIFSLDEEGIGERIKMKGISPNIDFSFDFQDLDLHRVNKE